MCVSNSLNTKNTVKGAVHDVCANYLSIKIVNAYRALLNFRQLKKHLGWNIPQIYCHLSVTLHYSNVMGIMQNKEKSNSQSKKKAVVIRVRPLVR